MFTHFMHPFQMRGITVRRKSFQKAMLADGDNIDGQCSLYFMDEYKITKPQKLIYLRNSCISMTTL